MPKLGDVRKPRYAGLRGKKPVIWHACAKCGKERWVRTARFNKAECKICRVCKAGELPLPIIRRGENHWNWKGGRYRSLGYVLITIQPDNFFYDMTDKSGAIFEHRYIMAQHLGRCLQRWEIVHHKNHIRDDNRIENLELLSDIGHKQITILEQRIKKLEETVEEQGKFIKLLQWEIKENAIIT